MSEQIINEIKKFSPVVFVFVIICFFLPFVSFSCGGEKIITLSGVQLVTGTTVEEPSSPGDMFGRPQRESERVDPEPLAIIALVITIAGLGLSFIKNRKGAIAPAIAGGAAAISFLAMKYKIDREVLREAEGALQAEYNFGFWLAFLLLILAVVLNLFLFTKREKTISPGGEGPGEETLP